VKLISECRGPAGEPMQRVIQVNACHGLVMLHELRNAEGKVIASASFSGHYHDPETKLVLVKQIRLELPQDKMLLVLKLDGIRVNPSVTDGDVVFTLPQLPGHKTIDLAELARSHRGAGERQFAFEPDLSAPERPESQKQKHGTPEFPAPGQPRAMPASGQTPELRFEAEPENSEPAAPQFEPPGGQFELPAAESNMRPTENAFRGQSPTGTPTAPSRKPGVWERLKSALSGRPSADAPPAGYSRGASRSSWGPPRLGQE
jgi:hypothetical protein